MDEIELQALESTLLDGVQISNFAGEKLVATIRKREAERAALLAVLQAAYLVIYGLEQLERDCANNCFNFPKGHVRRIGDELREAIDKARALLGEVGDRGEGGDIDSGR
jgi:hypothetical protein